MENLRKSQAQFREKLRKLRFRQNYGFLIKNVYLLFTTYSEACARAATLAPKLILWPNLAFSRNAHLVVVLEDVIASFHINDFDSK